MREILENLPVYMMVGIVGVIAVSQFSRILGAILGVLFWAGVAVVGSFAYAEGHAIGFPGLRFTRTAFLLFCGAFALLHVFAAWQNVRARQRREARRRMLEEDS